MRKFLLALILVLCSTPVFAQSFGRVEADLLRANGTIENVAPEATAAVVRIYTDDGDDNADKYSLNVSTADVFSIQNNGTAIWSITSAGAVTTASTATFTTTANVSGAEGGDATLQLWADEGDDNADKFSIVSPATNTLAIKNNTTDLLTMTSAGVTTFTANTVHTFMVITPQASPPGTPAAGTVYVDTTGNTLCIYNGSAWKGIMPATDGNCA